MTLRRTLIAGLIAAGAAGAIAAPLTPAQSLHRALGSAATQLRHKAISYTPDCVYTKSVNLAGEATPALYVMSMGRDAGYIITSADDRLRPLLAVVDSGNFDYDALPEATKWWLGEYAHEIEYYLNSGQMTPVEQVGFQQLKSSPLDSKKLRVVKAPADWEIIEPMVTTKWDQTAPYNNQCPMDGSYRSVTGCVATGMAQVVNYHKFAEGKGSHSYVTRTKSIPVSFNYENWRPDFSKMQNGYSSGATGTSASQVALLNLACGVAVDMDYTSQESGAFGSDVAPGLINYMSYDPQSTFYNRGAMLASDWEELCYDAIKQGYPLIYCGSGTAGGHCFVCDGYAGDGLFHINWGWAGAGPDGNYSLSALDPPQLGTGGGAGGFNSHQTVTVAVPGDGNHTYVAPADVEITDVYGSNFSASYEDNILYLTCNLMSGVEGGLTWYQGWLVRNTEGYNIDSEMRYEMSLPTSSHYYPADSWNIEFDLNKLIERGDGTYYVYLGYQLSNTGQMRPVRMESGNQSVRVTVADGQVDSLILSMGIEPPQGYVRVQDILVDAPESIEPGTSVQLTAQVLPENATDQTVTWSTTNSKATIDEDGLLTLAAGARTGTLRVFATANDDSGVKKLVQIKITRPSGVEGVEEEAAEAGEVYDLQGRKALNPTRTVTKGKHRLAL